ncbi:DnaA ATPase domain-containing protein [Candidatus Similichlamydia epinepheli]|uniref:DnaA ATPase domain-containing protein n=1 Tax=Candidatus Similichlamydia epinepheli TaxID=1903953 RepID=UPI000D35369B|nr:DnaA/Hda family protein [Candidatus Similichlamydia epinepheli]
MKSTKRVLVESIFSDIAKREPNYLLRDFLEASGNVFAKRLFEGLLEEECEPQLGSFNPIYLWGPSGCGKTHLMIGTAVSLRKLSHTVLYATCDTFIWAVLRAIRSECLNEFQNELRSCSVLMIDEVSDLSNRSRMQEEFFHAFNTLRTAGKQIILSSKIAPHQLVAIENRLISRFEWGLLVPMTLFSETDQVQIINKLLESGGFSIEKHGKEKLAKIFEQDISRLIKWLDTLLSKKITSANLEPLLQEKQDNNKKIPDFNTILETVCAHFQVEQKDVLSMSQKKIIATPRRVAMYLCRTLLRLSTQRIGHAFKRDNTTVSLSCKTISKLLLTDANLREKIEEIKKLFLPS